MPSPFTAVGVLFCMVWTLTVIPAGLALTRRTGISTAAAGPFPRRDRGGESTWPRRFARPFDQVRRRTVLAVVALLALAVPFGLGRLVVQDSWIDGFAETSPFRQSTETVSRLFHGTHLLLVSLDARSGAILGELRAAAFFPPGPPEGFQESAQVPERLELRIAAAGLDPAALPGERVLVGTVPSELANRRPFRERRADLLAEVTAAVLDDDRIRVELVPDLNESARRFLTSRPDRRWTFFATGERMFDPRILERVRETGAFIEEHLADIEEEVTHGNIDDHFDHGNFWRRDVVCRDLGLDLPCSGPVFGEIVAARG